MPDNRSKGSFAFTATVLALLAVIIAGVLCIAFQEKRGAETGQTIKQSGPEYKANEPVDSGKTIKFKEAGEAVLEKGSSVVDIAKKAGPSIVGIRTSLADFMGGIIRGLSEKPLAEGSGIIISQDGYVLTNYHVVQFADPAAGTGKIVALEVFLADGRQARAEFVGGDRMNDLAVVKVTLDNLPAAELGDSSELEVGEPVVAIGNPLGLELAGTVTVGVVSALNRIVATEDVFLRLIQTDAAINPGNSGGALINSRGQVIGVNSIKVSVPGVEGLGFAIPINDAKEIAEQLVKYGYVRDRPSSGIKGKEISEVFAGLFGMPRGILVIDVKTGSGAEKAGIKTGDVIISFAGKEIKSIKDFYLAEKEHKRGDTVDVEIVRRGERKKLKLVL